MSTTEAHTYNRPHRGTFAEGEAMPDKFAGEDYVGSVRRRRGDSPDKYAGEDRVGCWFADSQV